MSGKIRLYVKINHKYHRIYIETIDGLGLDYLKNSLNLILIQVIMLEIKYSNVASITFLIKLLV